MSCSTDRTYTLAEVQAYLRKAHERGKAAGQAAGEAAVLHGLRTVSALNGSGLRVLKTIHDAAGHDHGEADGRFTSGGEGESTGSSAPKKHPDGAAKVREDVFREYPDVHLDLYKSTASDGELWTLSRIVVPKGGREAGVGTKVMQRVIEEADRHGATVALSPSSDFGGNKKRLEEFYSRFGFKPNKGRSKDYSISETMVRRPNSGGAVTKAAAYVESEHPRDKLGEFMAKGDIDAARGNPAKEAALRERVAPEHAHLLEHHLANPGHTPEARAFHPAAQSAGHKRGIGEEHGEAVAAWVTAVTAAIRHGADYDHGDVQRGIERATSGQTTKLRRVLRVLDPETLVSHQPATKEGVQRRIREIISTAIHAAKDIRAHVVRNEAERREKELHEHAVQHALHLRDAVGHLQRMEGWQIADPASSQPGDAVHAARERIAALLGHEEGAAVKAFKEVQSNEPPPASHPPEKSLIPDDPESEDAGGS